MKKLTPEQAWENNWTMAVAAVRYCLGRRTYIVGDCADWLIDVYPILPDRIKKTIQRDIEEAFEQDDDDREEGLAHRTLGMECDRREWERVRKLWAISDNAP